MTHLLSQRVAALETENDELREQVRQLRDLVAGVTGGDSLGNLWRLGLTATEEKVVRRLFAGGRISKEQIFNAVYDTHRADCIPAIKIVDVYICKVRRKLEPYGINIQTHWGAGYEMLEPDARRLLDVISGEDVQPA